MRAENDLRDITHAEDPSISSSGKSKDPYAATETGKTSRLVFPGPRMQLRTQIATSSRTYELKELFVVDIDYHDDEIVFVSHRTVPVHAYGRGFGEAWRAFSEAFDLQWRNLVEVPEETLTSGGLKRRRALQVVVEKVVNVG